PAGPPRGGAGPRAALAGGGAVARDQPAVRGRGRAGRGLTPGGRRTIPSEEAMREFRDEDGALWQAVAVEAVVAHGKQGAVLAFRPAAEPEGEPLRSDITFNSMEAADFALRTLGEKE